MNYREIMNDWLDDWLDKNDNGEINHQIQLQHEQQTFEHYKTMVKIKSHVKDKLFTDSWVVKYTFDGDKNTLTYTSMNNGKKQPYAELIGNIAKSHMANMIDNNENNG